VTKDAAAPSLEQVEAVFYALAHEARRHIVLLLGHSGGELPSGYLAQRFSHSWPTTTRHLNVLEHCGLVEVRREGRGSFYRLNREFVQRVLGRWLDNLEPPTPTKTWTSSGPKSVSGLSKAKKGTSRS
jgi:DNA-binding transcriptional ArsR family regulator